MASLVPQPCSSLPLLPFPHVVLAPAKWWKDRGRRIILVDTVATWPRVPLVEGVVEINLFALGMIWGSPEMSLQGPRCMALDSIRISPSAGHTTSLICFFPSRCPLRCCCGLNCVPQKDTLKSQPLTLVNVTFFGNKIFANVIHLR